MTYHRAISTPSRNDATKWQNVNFITGESCQFNVKENNIERGSTSFTISSKSDLAGNPVNSNLRLDEEEREKKLKPMKVTLQIKYES